MTWVQTLMLTSYDWQLQTTQKNMKKYAENLLQNDNFACDKICESSTWSSSTDIFEATQG